MDMSESSTTIPSVRPGEHTEDAHASVSSHSGLGNAWGEKAEMQRKHVAKSVIRSAFISPTVSRSAVSALDLSGIHNDSINGAVINEANTPPPATAGGNRATLTFMPARRSIDEVLGVSGSPLDPTANTQEPVAPSFHPQNYSSLPCPSHDIHDVSSEESLGTRNQMVNFGDISINRAANVVFSNADDNARYKPSSTSQNFGNVKFAPGSSGIFGNVNNHYYSPALFGGLQALTSDAIDDAAINYRKSRASIQSVSRLPIVPMVYMPHASVSKPEIRSALIKIAVVCQFLDSAFAQYFRNAIGHLQGTEAKLCRLREQICSRQNRLTYIGPFGEYCERVSRVPKARPHVEIETYGHRATGDEVQPYLQDALEVPYWNMMADQFIKSSEINNPLTYEAVSSVVNDKRRELRLRLQQVKQKWPGDLPQEIEDGIARRISVLDALLAPTSDKYDSLEEQQVQTLQRSPTSGPDSTSAVTDPTAPMLASLNAKASTATGVTELEKVSLLSLFLVFTVIAMVPFAMGFAGYWSADPSNAVGSMSDPDSKWLIASTLLAIFGNVYAAVPLWKITRGSVANIISQVFLYFSIVLGISSICVYPFWNKAWSSSLSFFCSYFAIGSVFISAQHTSDTASGGPTDASKVKKE